MYSDAFYTNREIRRHHDHNHDHNHNDIDDGLLGDDLADQLNHALSHAHTHTHSHSHTHTNSKAVLNRISKLTGHLNAVKNMVEDGRDCAEVLIQLAAVRSALNSTMKIILKDHIDHCIVDAVNTGDTETIAELNKAIEILMK